MTNREAALKTLRLPVDASRADIISAYNRLARRYPLQQFPERHARLLQAKSLLLNPELAFAEVLKEDVLDLSWLNQYSRVTPAEHEMNAAEPGSQMQNGIQELLRPHLLQAAAMFNDHRGIAVETMLDRLISELGEDGLRRLRDELGVPDL